MEGWIKLNSDGAYKDGGNCIRAGGLLRDHQGKFVKGFVSKTYGSSAFKSEVFGLLQGLILATELGINKLEIELDALEVVNVVSSEVPNNSLHHAMIKKCKEMLNKTSWQVKLKHISRSGNQAADWLAAFGETCTGDLTLFNNPLDGLTTILEIDNIMSEAM